MSDEELEARAIEAFGPREFWRWCCVCEVWQAPYVGTEPPTECLLCGESL